MRKLELLAPAGSLDICKGVIDAGADAVYLGGNMFGARAYAQNFDRSQLFEALDYAHIFGKKIFLTVNTLLKNTEMEQYLYDYIAPLYKRGLDAAIVQDLGVTSFLHRNFPELPLHGSTQMSGTCSFGAELMRQNGISRIVTAREISIGEIRKLYDETGMEIESFIHGALCYCYSGQCLLSSLLGGRSGNRGRCAQPCRLKYDVIDNNGKIYNKKGNYPISPKDLCTLELLPQMAKAGVYSFKIEGRMKQLEYAAGVTSIYRKYLDLCESGVSDWKVEQKDINRLMDLGNRNGFTEGYYLRRNDRSVLSLTTSAHRAGIKNNMIPGSKHCKVPVTASAKMETGTPAVLSLEYGDICITRRGTEVQPALKQPLQRENVADRLKKTGDTPFEIENLHLELSDDAFLPVKQINELRRDTLEDLKKAVLKQYVRALPDAGASDTGNNEIKTDKMPGACTEEKKQLLWNISVLVRTEEQLKAVLENPVAECIYLDFSLGNSFAEFGRLVERIHQKGKRAVYAFPFIFREDSAARYRRQKDEFFSCKFDGVLVRSFDALGFVKSKFPEISVIVTDQSLYTFSDEAVRAYMRNGSSLVTAPHELNEKEFRHRENRATELVVYGWIPVMHTAQCIYKNFDGCLKGNSDKFSQKRQPRKHTLYLQDRYFKKFLITNNCLDCYNSIYNCQPLYLFAHADRIRSLSFASLRLEFLNESGTEAAEILNEFSDAFLKGHPVDLKKRENRYTNGHFKRGVE